MSFTNSIFYKSLSALYNLNTNKDGKTKSLIVDAIYKGLVIGREGLDLAKLEMALSTATGDWLDFWGTVFGVYRIHLEEDDEYRERIIEEVIAPKSTIPALKRATSRYLKAYKRQIIDSTDIRIFEPWTQLIKFDERGKLDDSGRIISYDYWNYAVIDISLPDISLVTPDLIKYLNRIKAAGVRIVFSLSPVWGIVSDPLKEVKRYRIWKKINRRTYIIPVNFSDTFKLLADGYKPHIKDSTLGGLLDAKDYLEGKQKKILFEIDFARTIKATGPIREHRSSGVLSLLDYIHLSKKKDLTLEEAFELENKSINAPSRLNEGKLTMAQLPIAVKTEYVENVHKIYVPYKKAKSTKEGYSITRDNILNYMSFNDLEDIGKLNDVSIEDLFDALLLPRAYENEKVSNAIRKIKLKLMEDRLKEESYQPQIRITSEQLD